MAKYILHIILLLHVFIAQSQFSDQHYLPVSVIDLNWFVDDPQYRLVTTESTPVNVTVKNPATNSILANLTINPGTETIYNSPYKDTFGGLSSKGLLMEGDGVFSVTGIGDPLTTNMGFAWVSKGRVGLGKEFRVFAPSNNFRAQNNSTYGNHYSVIATETCQVTFLGFPQGDGTFSLNAGECYTLNAGNTDNQGDFMDAIITSTGDIAVLNQTIQFRNGGINADRGGSEDGSDMLVPTNMIGDHYIAQEIGTDYITVVGAFDNTPIYINGVLVDTINKGEYRTYDTLSWSLNRTMEIKGDKNFYCWQLVSNPQSGYVLLSPLGCGNNQSSSIVPTGNYSDQTLSIIANSGDIVSIGGNTLTPVSSSSDFDFYIETTYGGTAVHSITSNGPLNVTSTTYEGAGSTGATYAGWGDVIPADTLALLSATCNEDSVEVLINLCGLEGKISAGHPISAYIGNPFIDSFANQFQTLFTTIDLDSSTCEQFLFKAPTSIINDSIYIVSNVVTGETLPLLNDSLASRCSPDRSVVGLQLGYFDYNLTINNSGCSNEVIIQSPFDYSYSLNGGSLTSDTIFTNLAPQTHLLEIYDAMLCRTDTQFLITSSPPISFDTTTQNATCNGFSDGSINITPQNGMAPFQYSIDGTNYDTNNYFNMLNAGNYTIYIIDGGLCTDTLNFVIDEPIALSTTVITTDISCTNLTNGMIAVNTTGGATPYSYSFNGGGFGSNSTFMNLDNGIYQLIVRDSNLCHDTVSITLTEPQPINASILSDTCIADSITIRELNTNGQWQYAWYDNDQFTNSISTNNELTVLPTIDTRYYLIITDTNNCTDTVSSVINLTPTANFNVDTNQSCAPYTFLFTNTSTYQTPLTCEWNFNGDIIQDCSSEIAYYFDETGSYDVSLAITDANGCSSDISQPNIVTVVDRPEAFFSYTPQDISNLNTSLDLVDHSINTTNIEWIINNSLSSTDSYYQYPLEDTSSTIPVCLIAQNTLGCADTTCETIAVKNKVSIYVPNSFSPNNDGINDVFIPFQINRELIVYEFLVFDRWGELLFQTNNPKQYWDGLGYKTDVYVWKVSIQSIDQTRIHTMHGHVTLVK